MNSSNSKHKKSFQIEGSKISMQDSLRKSLDYDLAFLNDKFQDESIGRINFTELTTNSKQRSQSPYDDFTNLKRPKSISPGQSRRSQSCSSKAGESGRVCTTGSFNRNRHTASLSSSNKANAHIEHHSGMDQYQSMKDEIQALQ